MKIWKLLLLVLAVAVGAPTVSYANEAGGHRSVASAKKHKKGKKGKKGKHGKKKKGSKHASKGKKSKKVAGNHHHGASHAPANEGSVSPVSAPVPGTEMTPAKDDLPPANTGNLGQ